MNIFLIYKYLEWLNHKDHGSEEATLVFKKTLSACL